MEEFFKFIGGSAIALSIVAYLIKSLTKHLLNKDISVYKLELQKDISVYKLELQKVAYEHQVRFEKLQTTRGEVIAKLYELLVSADMAMKSTTSPMENLGKGENWFDVKKEKFKHAADCTNKFREYYSRRRIYFNDEFCGMTDKFVDVLIQVSAVMITYISDADINDNDERNDMSQAWKAVSKDPLPKMKKQLENEFRKMLGVDLTN